MGSWSMFDDMPCHVCQLITVEAMWLPGDTYTASERQRWLTILRDSDFCDFGVLNSLNMPNMLPSFFLIDRRRAQRIHFLRCVLDPIVVKKCLCFVNSIGAYRQSFRIPKTFSIAYVHSFETLPSQVYTNSSVCVSFNCLVCLFV